MLCTGCSRFTRGLQPRFWKLGEPGPSCLVRSQSTVQSNRPLKIAIIGAGPSGFYTASRILSLLPSESDKGKNVQIHVYERLPTPYGLVRYGVAPDHPEVKNCQHKFDELASDARFKYFGNVSVGSQSSSSPTEISPRSTLSSYTYPHALHISLSSLLPYYSTVIFTYGASLSNPLSNVPGSSSSLTPLDGVFPALALVGWYNGHPAFSRLSETVRSIVSSSAAENVAVIGQGNVALDVARILLKPLSELAKTDLPEPVLEVLSESKVKRVSVVGRRGPGQVAFTTKEFREMLKLPGVRYSGLGSLDPDLLLKARDGVEHDRPRKRLLGLMETGSTGQGEKEFSLEFLRSPKAFQANSTGSAAVASVGWMVNELLDPPEASPAPPSSQTSVVPPTSPSQPIARPTTSTVTTSAGLVIESVGYRSEPLGVGEEHVLPFDVVKGRARNVSGRLVNDEGTVIPGLYAAGWVARGPVGVIASTMNDAYRLSSLVLDDHFGHSSTVPPMPGTIGANSLPEHGVPEPVERGLRDGSVISLDRWHKIDQAEVERGRRLGKEREKFINVEDMLAAAQ
ncbi:hypothetical protein BD324DRAFT_579105 [Kockovaella imperatae]|uniref:NADPH:adrenodoxin oxidoreductase, mitochondrial n=1 Tax=Kockovaella imperatae TaxID=4999 RepID=A0A1Y1UHT7_9TREE|nr:hypothetical protein BD324DRAFT_579105 [Kockovaella imperatae]ORX37633.1 hypothetical protein BD324DRAFT_579105 [Kockovaella imperatae]